MTDDIINGTLDGLRVSDAVLDPDGRLLPEHGEPAADENWSLVEFSGD